MRLFYTDHYVLPLPAGHRFPMEKYARLRERVLSEGVAEADQLRCPEAATDADLLRAHDPDYVRRVKMGELTPAETRRIGFPWSAAMVERSRRSAGATMEACRAALEDGVAVNLAGGTHHAFADRGEGYCVFNDSAIAARAMQAERRAQRILVVDCDVHQGNGTASIFATDPTVLTFSIHGAKNSPFRKEKSDLDVELPDGTGEDAYLASLRPALTEAIARSRADLAIYVSGADPYAQDRLGRLSLSREGLELRDRMVFRRSSPRQSLSPSRWREDTRETPRTPSRSISRPSRSRPSSRGIRIRSARHIRTDISTAPFRLAVHRLELPIHSNRRGVAVGLHASDVV